jgi:hypothetical protein
MDFLSMDGERTAGIGFVALLGQDQLAVFGDAQPVGFAFVVNQDFLAAVE